MPDATLQPMKPLPFDEAAQFFGSRLPMTRDALQGATDAAKQRAFVLGGIAKQDVMADVFTAMQRAVATGSSFGQFKKDIRHVLDNAGWEGASKHRLQNVFRTSVLGAYSAGKWAQVRAGAGDQVIQYDAVDDSHTRPTHAAMDGKVFAADDPIWDTWWPLNGYQCRCTTRRMSRAEAKARGLTVQGGREFLDTPVEVAPGRTQLLVPDPGFAGNPGKDFFGGLVAGMGPEVQAQEGTWSRLPGLSGPEKYGLGRLADQTPDTRPALDESRLLPSGKDRSFYEQTFRARHGFQAGQEAAVGTDPMGDAMLVPSWLVRKILKDPTRAPFIGVLDLVMADASEIWMVPYTNGSIVRLRKHIVTAWARPGSSATGIVVVSELERGVWKEISMSPLNDRTVEQKRVGVLVWRKS